MAAVPGRVTVVGLGLVGGSVLRALRAAGVKLAAYDNDPEVLQQVASEGYTILETAAAEPGTADVIVLCVPPGEAAAVIAMQQEAMAAGAVVTDVCSVKQAIVDSAAEVLPSELLSQFVPGHPMAGTEHSGFAASAASLFQSRRVILTPLPQNSAAAVSMVEELWRACGAAHIDHVPAEQHDFILAAASHLPHMLAYSLMALIASREDSADIIRHSAGGLRDFTRIADSNPGLWLDIAMANRKHIASNLADCAELIASLAKAVDTGDEEKILTLFNSANSLRKGFSKVSERGNEPGG